MRCEGQIYHTEFCDIRKMLSEEMAEAGTITGLKNLHGEELNRGVWVKCMKT